MKMECQISGKMEEIMLMLYEFRHNHHARGVKILAKFIRRGFPVGSTYQQDIVGAKRVGLKSLTIDL